MLVEPDVGVVDELPDELRPTRSGPRVLAPVQAQCERIDHGHAWRRRPAGWRCGATHRNVAKAVLVDRGKVAVELGLLEMVP